MLGGVIDSDYRGEIKVMLLSLGGLGYTINAGDRIAQIVIVPIFVGSMSEVKELDSTIRASKGFASSGR